MIYDEGFEVFIGNLQLFHFNHYEKPKGIYFWFILKKVKTNMLQTARKLYLFGIMIKKIIKKIVLMG